MYPNDGPSWGTSFKITPVGATPKLTMQVLLSAGDDFEQNLMKEVINLGILFKEVNESVNSSGILKFNVRTISFQ